MKLLLTGDPGCGKTTALACVVDRLRGSVPMTGFLTEEVRVGGRRTGFRGVTLDGRSFTLARQGGSGPHQVGPYSVITEELEAIGVPSLQAGPEVRLVVLDEVGKMESFSGAFRSAVERLLAADTPLLASVAWHGVGFPKKVRNDPRVTLQRMRREGRDAIVGEILRRLAEAGVVSGTEGSHGSDLRKDTRP